MKRFPFVRAGLCITVAPILMAFVASLFQGGSMFDEGSGTGTYLWLLFFSIPVGLFLSFVGIILKVVRRK